MRGVSTLGFIYRNLIHHEKIGGQNGKYRKK